MRHSASMTCGFLPGGTVLPQNDIDVDGTVFWLIA
jgi:hypothetical protein